eukprot:361186-Chlamydomonas_euryale.AAC.2
MAAAAAHSADPPGFPLSQWTARALRLGNSTTVHDRPSFGSYIAGSRRLRAGVEPCMQQGGWVGRLCKGLYGKDHFRASNALELSQMQCMQGRHVPLAPALSSFARV